MTENKYDYGEYGIKIPLKTAAEKLYLDTVMGNSSKFFHLVSGSSNSFCKVVNSVIRDFDEYFTYKLRIDEDVIGSYAKNDDVVLYKKVDYLPNVPYKLIIPGNVSNTAYTPYRLKVTLKDREELAFVDLSDLDSLAEGYLYVKSRVPWVYRNAKPPQNLKNIVDDLRTTYKNDTPIIKCYINQYICDFSWD